MNHRVLPPANNKNDVLSKIITISELKKLLSTTGRAGSKVVLCHGVFDLLHMGHVRHFQEARAMGDLLIVSITADAFVNKGPGKPVFSQGLKLLMEGLRAMSQESREQLGDLEEKLGIVQWDSPFTAGVTIEGSTVKIPRFNLQYDAAVVARRSSV